MKTEYGVSGMVKERREAYRDTYTRGNIIGVCLCILSAGSHLFGGIIISEDGLFMVLMLSLMFFLAGVGVTFFIRGRHSLGQL